MQSSSVASNMGSHMACAVNDIPAYASMLQRFINVENRVQQCEHCKQERSKHCDMQ